MANKSPQTNYFNKVSTYNKLYKVCFYISVIVVSILGLMKYSIWADIIGIIFLVILIFIERTKDYYHFKAEESRREDYFDNSFNTKFSLENSDGYYDTEEISYGMYKMAVNLFENSLYSKVISERMRDKARTWNMIGAIIVASLALYGIARMRVAIPIVQLFLSKEFVGNYLDINTYYIRVDKIFKSLQQLFQRLVNTRESIEENNAEIIKLYMEYETNISDKKVLLDSRLFNEINPKLTKDWEEIKKRYGIK